MLRCSLGMTRVERMKSEYIRETAGVGGPQDKVREARPTLKGLHTLVEGCCRRERVEDQGQCGERRPAEDEDGPLW